MALYSLINRSCLALSPTASRLLIRYFSNHVNKTFNLETDVLDDFTSQLMQKKSDKWEMQKVKAQKLVLNSEVVSQHDKKVIPNLKYYNDVNINTLFQTAIENEDYVLLLDLMSQCIDYNKSPSVSIILQVLSLCSQKGDKLAIERIAIFCKQVQPVVLEENSNFNHFKAEAIWVKGNITESLRLFEETYSENCYLRRRIRLMLQNLFSNVIKNRSEAALVNIIKFSESLVKNFQDYFPLTCIWQACYLSEWFTDQSIALDLFEKNEGLRKSVVNRIPFVIAISLRSHQTDVVYRLLEVLLKFEMKQQYSRVLTALLDYQYHMGDIRSCMEIIQWSIKNNIELPNIHHENFIKLLIKYNIDLPPKPTKQETKLQPTFKF